MDEKQEAIKKAIEIPGLMSDNELDVIWDLARKYHTKDGLIAEVGTYMGRTTSLLCSAVEANGGHVISIDLFEEFLEGEIRNEYEKHSRNVAEYWLKGHLNRTLIRGNPVLLDKFEGKYDFVFLDGDHRYHAILHELDMFKYHTNVLIGHDWHDERVSRAVNKFMEYHGNFSLTNHSTQQGIWELTKNG